ncbi:hypothetical protein EB796_010658 [Bugula neritina]|uniref:Uncharacterized protein n=1 Tax=Bugula neritina TaxID=10212 RepID=A0A7J7JX87_BUGNE|nr:hypothetical protein EB796_010658 [Bugula neritina]
MYSTISSSHAAAVRQVTARQQPPDEETQEIMDFMLGLGLVPANIHSQLASRRPRRRRISRPKDNQSNLDSVSLIKEYQDAMVCAAVSPFDTTFSSTALSHLALKVW